MPVRSLNSSVLKWPDAQTVVSAFEDWAKQIMKSNNNVLQVGYFGSYAKRNWGVGSDLDIIIIVKHSDQHFVRRATEWDTITLPVPADVIIYTLAEWRRLPKQGKFYQALIKEVNWV